MTTRMPMDNDADNPEVSVVIPCLDEERTVGVCVDEAFTGLARAGVSGEVIVVDNGSSDSSSQVARGRGARIVRAPLRGYGRAIQEGVAAAHGRYVIVGDADGSHDLSQLSPFIEQLRGGHDMVVGNRYLGGIRPGAMTWLHRYVGNPVLSGMLNLFFNTPIRDVHCGFRAFTKVSYGRLELRTPGMEFASEMIIKARMNSMKLTEVPVVHHPDSRGRRPHLRTFRDGWRHLRLLLLFCPFWLYLIPSGALLAIGTALMMFTDAGLLGRVTTAADLQWLLIGATCLVLGYQTLWLWAYARIYGWSSGILPADTFSLGLFEWLNLEAGLSVGFVLFALGLGSLLDPFRFWLESRHVEIALSGVLRPGLGGLVLLIGGVQTIYGSFFLSMLGLARGRTRPT